MHTGSLMEEESSIASAEHQNASMEIWHGFAMCRFCGTQSSQSLGASIPAVEFVDHRHRLKASW